jgi:glutamate dehydrogenase
VAALTDSPELTDEVFLDSVLPYFPEGMRRDFADLVPHHRLYRQLAATDIAGELVDRMGIVWAHDLAAELGRPLAEVAQAFWVARRVSSSADCWDRLEAMADDPAAAVSPATEATLHSSTAAAVNELVRTWLGRPARFDPAGTASRCESLLAGLPEGMGLSGALLPGDVGLAASDLALFGEPGRRVRVLEAVEATVETGRSAAEGLEVLQLIDRLAGAGELAGAVLAASEASPPPGRIRLWQARAVADDLAAWRRRVARSVLLADPWPGAEAAAAAWAESNRPALARAAALSAAGGSSDPVALAALALRRLAQA